MPLILCLQKSKLVIEESAISPSSKDLKLVLLGPNKRTPLLLGDARGLLLGVVPFDGGEGYVVISDTSLRWDSSAPITSR